MKLVYVQVILPLQNLFRMLISVQCYHCYVECFGSSVQYQFWLPAGSMPLVDKELLFCCHWGWELWHAKSRGIQGHTAQMAGQVHVHHRNSPLDRPRTHLITKTDKCQSQCQTWMSWFFKIKDPFSSMHKHNLLIKQWHFANLFRHFLLEIRRVQIETQV